jgi:hypothetical protein
MITLPIYYTKEYKTKPPRSFLVSLNWYRNASYFEQNEVKQYYHSLVGKQLASMEPIKGSYALELALYYKSTNCDPSNIMPMIQKFTLDALQHYKIIVNDSARYDLLTTFTTAGQDKESPRCTIIIKES